ncbi:hypothetical protein [Paenibacillus herberti]|uniref:Uncharacterized protein n=1 Tax=Paenibacillus herberti TaxID=1619309 RepID=A0A229NWI4_9BACL|nr:hypothetical protein [Paenibacillus herberti]OXM14237.1 hypothetical protein CGZ75_14840 [Paenibacillus herberti]
MGDSLAETSSSSKVSPRGVRLVLLILVIIALKKRRKKKPCNSCKPCNSWKRCKPCKPCPPLLGETIGVDVVNETKSITFTLTSVNGPAGNPPIGSTLAPGGVFNFEVKSTVLQTNRVTVVYTAVVNGEAFQLSFVLVNTSGITLNVDSIRTTGPVTTIFSPSDGKFFIEDKTT